MEAVATFFQYDSALALTEESSSIRDYFEATGGIEALSQCQMHPNANIQEQATELLKVFFDGAEDTGHLENVFSQQYQGNGLDSNQPFRKDSWEAESDEADSQENEDGDKKLHYYYTNIKEDEKIVFIKQEGAGDQPSY